MKEISLQNQSAVKILPENVNSIFSMNIAHDASVCYLVDGKVKWMIEEERLSHRKHDSYPLLSLLYGNAFISKDSLIAYTTIEIPMEKKMVDDSIDICLLVASKVMRKNKYKCKSFQNQHHLSHASIGFYNSGFEEAAVVVVDGAGAIIGGGHEVESIYKASYPCNFELLHQRYAPVFIETEEQVENPTTGIGMAYAAASEYIGFNYTASGKTMGLAPYGKDNPNIKPFVINGEVNEELFVRVSNGVLIDYYEYIYPEGKIDLYKLYNDGVKRCSRDENDIVRSGPALTAPDQVEDPRIKFSVNCDLAYRMQKDFESYMIDLIKKAVELTGCKNIVLTGGCALNCVANYEYLKYLPEGGKLFVEPICYDAGLSAGQAMLEWRQHTQSKEIYPLKSLYLGIERQHDIPESAYDTTLSEVVDVIENGNPVGIFQGRSEQGPRALGNRSLLFDPRNPNAQLIMNKKKGRELWRPFAASVLLDHVHDWFDMRGLDESPFMMFAVNAHEKVWDKIPGVLHVDKTCRIQTVSREQNKNYYDLIEEFYKRTGIPMLLNTSFNLGGDTICETVDDVIETLQRSELEYTYFPNQKKMLYISENSNAGKRGKINYSLVDDSE
jgi:carbamoyltransferase